MVSKRKNIFMFPTVHSCYCLSFVCISAPIMCVGGGVGSLYCDVLIVLLIFSHTRLELPFEP